MMGKSWMYERQEGLSDRYVISIHGKTYDLRSTIKGLPGADWHPDGKSWTVTWSPESLAILKKAGVELLVPVDRDAFCHESIAPGCWATEEEALRGEVTGMFCGHCDSHWHLPVPITPRPRAIPASFAPGSFSA